MTRKDFIYTVNSKLQCDQDRTVQLSAVSLYCRPYILVISGGMKLATVGADAVSFSHVQPAKW